MTEPTTEARMEYPQLNAAYLAGVAVERERIAAAVRGLATAWNDDPDDLVTRAAVLAIVEADHD